MNFNQTSHHLALAMLVMTALYTLVYAGLTGLLLCSSVSLLIAAFVEPFELVVAGSIIFTMFYIFYLKRYLRRLEPFANSATSNASDETDKISKLISNMMNPPKPAEPTGVLSKASEGFANPNGEDKKEDGAPSNSTSAFADIKDAVDPEHAEEVSHNVKEEESKEKFEEQVHEEEVKSATSRKLFQEGKTPSEYEEGPKIDTKATMKSLFQDMDPDAIKGMSSDAQQLVKTQETLMGMLEKFGPILSDGHEIMQKFQNFMPNIGVNPLAPFADKK
jgi:hypothetical protein